MNIPNAITALAIGHGEPCPFCVKEPKTENIFISREDNDILIHMLKEHKNDFNKALHS